MNDSDRPLRIEGHPELSGIDSPAWRRALAEARRRVFERGEILFHEGDSCRHYYLIESGLVRLQRVAADGHEIMLGHVAPGRLCPLTGITLMAGGRYPAEIVAERESRIVVLPGDPFKQAVVEDERLRDHLFHSFARGMDEMLVLVEAIAFGDMTARLVEHLLAHDLRRIEATHQELAAELGTAREVVSRLLKRLERRRLLRLGRGEIEIVDREALARWRPAGRRD